jgi:WD40 repeat protein
MITQFANLPGNQLMTSAADGTIRTWDWTTGRHISTLAAHENAVRGFFLTNQRMVSGGMDGYVRVWNRPDGTISQEMREEVRAVWHLVSNPTTIALALLVESGKHLIEIWDASVL